MKAPDDGLQLGETVILDQKFNNASEVRITWLGILFADVTDGATVWTTMRCRLTKKQQPKDE